jgi:alpha-2-macroglobulin
MSFIDVKASKWIIVLISFFVLAAAAVALEQPYGSVAGRVAIKESFGLATYKIKPKDKLYALVVGPRDGKTLERGVWVKPDGSFKIDRLPVGEYSLTVRAPGYGTYNQNAIYVREGKTETITQQIVLAVLEPSVSIASNVRIFTSKELPSFWISATGCNKAVIKIYKKDLSSLLLNKNNDFSFGSDLNLYKPQQGKSPKNFVGNEQPIKVLTRKLEPNHDDWARADFKLNEPLPNGDYIALAEVFNFRGKSEWNLMWFSVSDLGLIIKQAPAQTLVRAINLNDAKPQANVAVKLIDRDENKVLGTAKTGSDGFVHFELPDSKKTNYDLLALGTDGDSKAYGGIPFWRNKADNYQTYFYTERPIYRLGQTVYYKGIVRLATTDGLQSPKAGLAIKLTIEDPDNNKIAEQNLHTNANGSIHGTFDIPTDQKTGAYQVTLAYPDGTFSYENFEVAQYRKPEYQVEVTPQRAQIVAGEKIKANIRATYYFGAPVTNAKIKYTIYSATDWESRYKLMPRPSHYSYFDDWEDNYEDSSYAGDYISEGFASTDQNGEASIELETKPNKTKNNGPYEANYLDQRYKIQAEVTDLSRMTVVGSNSVSVANGQFVLFVQPQNYVYKAGEKLSANISALNYEGAAVSNQALELNLMRWKFNAKKNDYKLEVLKSVPRVITSPEGKAVVEFNLPEKLQTDTYFLMASANDEAGNQIVAEANIWLADPQSPYQLAERESQQEPLNIKLDKNIYKPGETAKLMITAPTTGHEGSEAIVSIESNKIHSYRVVPLKATAQLIELPIEKKYIPNVYVTVTFVGKKHQFYNQSQLVKVSPDERFLQIKVETDKQKYKPGETVNYKIKASHADGRPAPGTELSLGVVDESIYAIRPEAASDIRKFFYNQKYNEVQTLSSFPEELSGGPDKIEPRLRKDFRDVADWLPELITDQKGEATAQIKLPDNLTSWRATVRGFNKQTEVGSITQNITATQDLLVRLALPRFFREYDKGYLTAIVHNYTDQEQEVSVNLNYSEQFKTDKASAQKITIKPSKAERLMWPVEIVGSGQGKVKIEAIGKTAGDALEQNIKLLALGLETFDSKSGVLTKEDQEVSLKPKLPNKVDPTKANYKLSLAASSIGPVLGAFDKLIDYPYGCTEQTMSRLYPSVISVQLAKELNLKLDVAQKTKFEDVVKKGILKLTENQHTDGGWGWWLTDESSPYLTSYVLEGLFLLKSTDNKIDQNLLNNGLKWLQEANTKLYKLLNEPSTIGTQENSKIESLIDLAQSEYVLSLYKKETADKHLNKQKWWQEKINLLPPEALSYLILAYTNWGNSQAAAAFNGQLMKLANKTEGFLNWDYNKELAQKLGLKYQYYTYRYTGVESTALALRASLAVQTKSNEIEAMKAWLLLQRDKDGWQNTKTTASVLRSLLAEELLNCSGKAQFKAWVNLNTDKLLDLNYDQTNLYAQEHTLTVPVEKLLKQAFSLQKNGIGRLYFQSLLTYVLPLNPGQQVPVKSLPQGIEIKRSFYKLIPEPINKEGIIHFESKPLLLNQVKAGETVLMKITIQTPVALPYVLIEAPLPSGGEVLINDPKENLIDDADNSIQGDWGSFWWTHQDVLDDKLAFFASNVPSGKSEVHTLLRLEMPGEFQLSPVQLAGMYTSSIKAYSKLSSLKVQE